MTARVISILHTTPAITYTKTTQLVRSSQDIGIQLYKQSATKSFLMPLHHKPILTVKQSPNGKWRFRVSRYAPDRKGGKPGQENLITSQQFADKDNAERGFNDALDSMLLVAFDRTALIDALIRTGLLEKLNRSL